MARSHVNLSHMGTLTITTTSEQDARIVAAFGAKLGLGRNATGAEVKAAVIGYVRAVVGEEERRAAARAAMAGVAPIDPA